MFLLVVNFVLRAVCVGESKNAETEMPEEVTEEGIALVEEFLAAWASGADVDVDGEDVVMDDIEAVSNEAQLARLRSCVERFGPRIEANPWLRSVLEMGA